MVEFCNEWPKALSTDEICDKLFPIEVITRDIVADGSSLRDPRARVVTVQVIAVSVEQLVERYWCQRASINGAKLSSFPASLSPLLRQTVSEL